MEIDIIVREERKALDDIERKIQNKGVREQLQVCRTENMIQYN